MQTRISAGISLTRSKSTRVDLHCPLPHGRWIILTGSYYISANLLLYTYRTFSHTVNATISSEGFLLCFFFHLGLNSKSSETFLSSHLHCSWVMQRLSGPNDMKVTLGHAHIVPVAFHYVDIIPLNDALLYYFKIIIGAMHSCARIWII